MPSSRQEMEIQIPVRRLHAYNFRNIKELTFKPQHGINVIYGDNAKGKTNIIECIWMFTGERSFRGAKESQLITIGEENARIDLEFYLQNRYQTSTIRWMPKKEIYLNGLRVEKIYDYIGEFSAIVFSPEDLKLVKSGPDRRRNFLDVALSQIKPRYWNLMIEYNKILQQRNALLKEIDKDKKLEEMLDVWDEVFVKAAVMITKYRQKYINVLLPIVEEIYGYISNKNEQLKIIYQSTCNINGNLIYEEMKEYFEKKVLNGREYDIKSGFTQIGPHRDDLDIMINGISSKNFASQGQQRSIVLALKLAEKDILKNLVEKTPVILLDDVMSELDQQRKKYILSSLEGFQCFITCCDKRYFSKLEYGKIYNIDDLISKRV